MAFWRPLRTPSMTVPSPNTTTTTSSPAPSVSVYAAIAIVVADMVGVGVFTSLGFQVKDLTSNFSLLFLWFIGGLVALCGAFCYAELASMFPRSSGEYNFLTRAYNPAVGFMAGWLSATVGFSAPVALAAMAFGQYAKSILPQAPALVSGLVVIWLVTAVHLRGTHHGSVFQIAATLLKLALIVAFIVAGLVVGAGAGQPVSFMPSSVDPAQILSAAFAISLVFVMYSYSGWNAATYIVSEIREPRRNLPRALLTGTAIVAILYVSLNAVFLYTTPKAELVGKLDVAMVVGNHIFGAEGGRLVGALICLGLISTISAMMWIGPRVTMTMGEDVSIMRIFARRSRMGVPTVAIFFQAIVASLLLLSQSFEKVLEFIQFSLTFCSFLTVLGVIKLRFTHPDLARPYKAWGYPVTPLIFLAVSIFMMYYLVTTQPMPSLAGFGMMLAGLVLYGIATFQQTAAQRALSK